MASLITLLIPVWLLFILAFLAMVQRLYVVWRWEFSIISRWENLLKAIAFSNIAFFYAGVWLGWWNLETSIAISRIVWAWLLVASLYNGCHMAKRILNNGLE